MVTTKDIRDLAVFFRRRHEEKTTSDPMSRRYELIFRIKGGREIQWDWDGRSSSLSGQLTDIRWQVADYYRCGLGHVVFLRSTLA